MSLADMYSKPLEQIIEQGKIWLTCYNFKPDGTDSLGMPKQKRGIWWKANLSEKLSVIGEGETPREAIINLYNKL